MHLEFNIVIELGFEDEVVEPPADEGVRLDVGVGHVVLGTDLLLATLDELGLGCVEEVIHCSAWQRVTVRIRTRIMIFMWRDKVIISLFSKRTISAPKTGFYP
jgi:hypothetical protein